MYRDDDIDYDWGYWLRVLRCAYDLSQEEVGAMLGIDRMTVSGWERGYTPPYVTRVGVCTIFKIPESSLMELYRYLYPDASIEQLIIFDKTLHADGFFTPRKRGGRSMAICFATTAAKCDLKIRGGLFDEPR